MKSITQKELQENYPNTKFFNLLVQNVWYEVIVDTFDLTKTKKMFGVDCVSYYAYDKKGTLLNPISQVETIKRANVRLWDREKQKEVTYKVIL